MHSLFSGYLPFILYMLLYREVLIIFMQEEPCIFEAHLIHNENNKSKAKISIILTSAIDFCIPILLSQPLSTMVMVERTI